MSNNMIDAILAGDKEAFAAEFSSEFNSKLSDAIQDKRIELAQDIYNSYSTGEEE